MGLWRVWYGSRRRPRVEKESLLTSTSTPCQSRSPTINLKNGILTLSELSIESWSVRKLASGSLILEIAVRPIMAVLTKEFVGQLPKLGRRSLKWTLKE